MKARSITLVLSSILALASEAAPAADIPQIGGDLHIFAAKAVLMINGTPVVTYNVDETSSVFRRVDLTDWLTNGSNTVKLTVEAFNERGKANLELYNISAGEEVLPLQVTTSGEYIELNNGSSEGALLTLKVAGSGEDEGTIAAKDLPVRS